VTLGRCLAAVVLGRDDASAQHARLLQRAGSPFPPEPIRYVGGRLVQRAILKKEAAEDVGRRPPRAVKAFTDAFLPDGTHLAPPTLSSLRKVVARSSRS
jgi:hypothetical protein